MYYLFYVHIRTKGSPLANLFNPFFPLKLLEPPSFKLQPCIHVFQSLPLHILNHLLGIF